MTKNLSAKRLCCQRKALKAHVVHNPGRWERRLHRWREAAIGWLIQRRGARRLGFDAVPMTAA